MLVECVVACVLVVLGMTISLGLVRLAADLVILIVTISACWFALASVSSGVWAGWADVAWRSLATGAIAALLTLPVLPFSSFHRKK